MKSVFVKLISIYQSYFSFDKGILAIFTPGGVCRYETSCSEYTKQKISQFGVFKGSLLGLKRIWSCR